MSNYIDEAVQAKKQSIENKENVFEIGHVKSVQTYLLEVVGLKNVTFFERVVVARKGKGDIAEGYVDKININSVVVALTRKD